MIDRNSAILMDDCVNERVSNGGGENQQMECRRLFACSGKLVLHNKIKRCHESKVSRNSASCNASMSHPAGRALP